MANDKNFKVKNGVTVGTDIVFEDTNFSTTLTKTAPTENRTITFPNASGTVVLGNGLTTYSVKASSTTGGANLDLDAAGANTNTDSVKFAGAGISVVTQTDASTITITSTEADTLATVTGRGATTATAVSFTNDTQSTGTGSGAVVISGGLGVAKNLYVGENIVVTGNLTVQGTQTTISTTTLDVADKTIDLGVVETPTDETADGGGIILRGATNKTLLWDNANDNWTSSEHWNLVSGKQFKIDNTAVLTSTQVLGKGFTNAAGEIVTTDGTQTLSNKTISGGSASNLTGLSMTAGVSITEFSSDGTLAGDSDEAVPTEAAVKSYVDGSLTTYSVKASSTTGGANLDLDAAGANTNTDSVKFAGAGSVSVAQTDASTITITGAAPNNGALTLQVGGTAAATNNTVTVATGTGFTADSASASTYELRVGPALTALASQMTGAGSGFLRKNGADTFSLDTTTYLSAEADTLATVTGRGASTSTASTFSGGITTNAVTFSDATSTILNTNADASIQLRTRDTTVAASGAISIFSGNSTVGASGNIQIYGGNGTTITSLANISITGGLGTAATSQGGNVLIQGGRSNTTSTTSGTGGNLYLIGGGYLASSGTQTGGHVYIDGGGGFYSSGVKGNVYLGTKNGDGFNTSGTTEVHIGHGTSKNYIRGITEYETSTEVLNTKTGATGTVVHNLLQGNTWYHSSIAANFTANFTNVPTTNNRTVVCTLVLNQGATAYIPNAVQIDGVAQAINWTGHTGAPTGDANDINIATFVLLRQSNAWTVLGSVVNNPSAVVAASTLQEVTDNGATTSNAISITNSTASTTTGTGALIVSGGVGVGGGLNVGGAVGVGADASIITGTGKTGNYLDVSGFLQIKGQSGGGGVIDFKPANSSFRTVAIEGALTAGTTPQLLISIAGSASSSGVNTAVTVNSSSTTSTSSTTGTLLVTGGTGISENLNVGGNLTVSGLTTLQETTEVLNTKTGATGTVVHDFSTGSIWYHSSIAANFTANFTNVPTTDNRTVVCTLVLNQGSTAYIPNAVQIDGVAQTINWTGHTGTPTGDANDINIATFILLRQSSTWTVLGSVVNNSSVTLATSTVAGLIELGSDTVQTTAANAVTSTASRTYALQLNASGQAVVNVPWTDTNTTYSAATSTVAGLIELGSDTVQTTAANAVTSTASRTYALQLNASGQAVVNVPWTDTDTNTDTLQSIADDTTNNSRYVTFVSSATGAQTGSSNANLRFNPSTGELSATNFNSLSDVRYKTDLQKIESALEKVKQLTGYTYTLIESGKRGAGLLAQDVENVQPESVGGTDDKKTLNYDGIIGLIVESIKELSDKIDNLKS